MSTTCSMLMFLYQIDGSKLMGTTSFTSLTLVSEYKITFDQFCKDVASAVILYVHKMAKMAMLVIAFEDLKRASSSGYCAPHLPLALP